MNRSMLLMLCGLSAAGWGGELNPPAGPTEGTMKTLAEVEPRTAIRQADMPLTINAAGSYYLAENVTCSGTGNAITISADQVTLDLNGFTMTGNSTGYAVLMDGRQNIEIRNGTIRSFLFGICETSTGGQNYTIDEVKVSACGKSAIYLNGCANCRIQNCTINEGGTAGGTGNLIYGISVGNNGIVSGNTVHNFGADAALGTGRIYAISTGSGCRIEGNNVSRTGIGATASYVCGIVSGYGNTVISNNCFENGTNASGYVYGFSLSNACTLTNNTAISNGQSAEFVLGFSCGNACIVSGNIAHQNGGSAKTSVYGISCAVGSTVINNTVYNNGQSATGIGVYGLSVGYGSTVTGNTSRGNGISATGTIYGIFLGGRCLVNNNTAYENNGTDMNLLSSCVYGTNLPNIGH